jgi:lipoyl(octanoyl) transferase
MTESFDAMPNLTCRFLGQRDYLPVYQAMQDFNARRDDACPDECWIVEHFPTYTLGQAGKPEHIITSGAIPVHRIDRGGQVTYHGPGQLVVYPLLNLSRRRLYVKTLVFKLEQAVIDWLATYKIQAQRRDNAPGVYVGEAKISALGLRVRRGCCYHGLSININMDLTPFHGINPCGYPNLAVTQLRDFDIDSTVEQAAEAFLPYLSTQLGYTHVIKTR